ncbi:PDZ domain-containing protein [Terrilactibacillus sp. S3-3]|nr:PDZ domain-containing protein [Terrilactibacillus sp. S3-3]
MVGNKVSIVSPIKGSPAEKAGLKPNDQILSINGKSTDGMNINQAVNRIRGKSGTYVKLSVKRPGVASTLSFNIKRGNIPLRTVTGKIIKRSGNSIGYIDISQFNENTDKEFKKTLSGLEKKKNSRFDYRCSGKSGRLSAGSRKKKNPMRLFLRINRLFRWKIGTARKKPTILQQPKKSRTRSLI